MVATLVPEVAGRKCCREHVTVAQHVHLAVRRRAAGRAAAEGLGVEDVVGEVGHGGGGRYDPGVGLETCSLVLVLVRGGLMGCAVLRGVRPGHDLRVG